MTMLADNPTWPEKKTELDKEPRLEKEPSVARGSPGWPLHPQGHGIPTPPPFPPQPTGQQQADHLDYLQGQGIPTTPPVPTQAQQVGTSPLVARNCPFCGGVLSATYVPSTPTGLGTLGNMGVPAQMSVGCHNKGCGMAPKMKCHPPDLPLVVRLWNNRYP